jgi:hypothetical protein
MDIATLDQESPIVIDRDEDPCPRDLGRVVAHRPILEVCDGLVERIDPLADVVGDFVGLAMLVLQGFALSHFCLESGLLLDGRRNRLAGEASQSIVVTGGKCRRDDDPFPALGAKGLGLLLEPLSGKAV